MSRRSRRGRRKSHGSNQPAVVVPGTGRNPKRRRGKNRRRRPARSTARRRRLSRAEMEELSGYFHQMPEPLLAALYKGLGGQPGRVPNRERMIQLAVRAIAQGSRLGNLLREMHQRDRQALGILIQCGGLAHGREFLRELYLSLGGVENEWRKVMQRLGEHGLVFATETRDNDYFYLVPDPLVEHLLEHLGSEMELPTFKDDEAEVVEEKPFSPPLDFSMTTLTTYMDQRPPRLTQRQEIYKAHKEEMDTFFSQLWAPDSDLFGFHIDFLMIHGMIELRGDRVNVNRDVVEEWLNLDPEDQRELIFQALDRRFPHAEWVLWAVHDTDRRWIPDKPLQALYRRWIRGEDWRKRFHSDQWSTPRTAERESFSFVPLVNTGMLEVGSWGQEKFYRLAPRALHLLEPPEDEGFSQFYLTPSFEIMAPAGLAPVLLFRIGEIAELTGCDRANTYKITEVTVEQALDRGWRRDDILEFLKENSQIGLPDNVEQTLRSWMGNRGDVEFHETTLLTVHRSAIRKVESDKRIKPHLLHRFAPGLYAVDGNQLPAIREVLSKAGFEPSETVHRYPGDSTATEARERLREMVKEARESSTDPLARAHAADTPPEELHPVPGSGIRDRRRARRASNLPPRVDADEADRVIKKAISEDLHLDMVYLTRNNRQNRLEVAPERMAIARDGAPVLVARDLEKDDRLTYRISQIERLRTRSKRRKQ